MRRQSLIIWILFIFISVGIAGGVLWYGKEVNRKIKVIQTEVMKQVQNNTTRDSALGFDEVWYPIPELGVEVKLNKAFAHDLVYVYEPHLTGIVEYTFGKNDEERQRNMQEAKVGKAYFSLKSLLNTVDSRCRYSARKALGTIEKTPKVQENGNDTFYPEYVLEPLGPGGTGNTIDYSKRLGKLFEENVRYSGETQVIYQMLSDQLLLSWGSHSDDFLCYNERTHALEQIDENTPIALMYFTDKDDYTIPSYQGTGAKTVKDAFLSIRYIK